MILLIYYETISREMPIFQVEPLYKIYGAPKEANLKIDSLPVRVGVSPLESIEYYMFMLFLNDDGLVAVCNSY